MRIDFDKLYGVLLFSVVSIIIIFLSIYGFSTKHHQGYYINNYDGVYAVMINWENAPDETSIRTYNREEALAAFKTLSEIHNK